MIPYPPIVRRNSANSGAKKIAGMAIRPTGKAMKHNNGSISRFITGPIGEKRLK